jgi:methionyl-tRNA formyltransferase
MKLAYLGTPAMAVPPLDALIRAGHELAVVVTGADKRRGRGSALSPSPVKAAALASGLHVSHDVDDLLAHDVDLGVVVAFGKIIRPHVLDAIPLVNMHFSLLPRWRGAAPVERALLAGDATTGVCIMRIERELDTGGVYARAEVPIGPRSTADELRASMVAIGSELLTDTLAAPLREWIDDPAPQVGESTYADKLTADDLEIDWNAPADHIDRQIRVGGAWTTFRGKRLKVLSADLIDGSVVPTTVQPEGKAEMPFDAWRNGARPTAGEIFGST